MKNKRLIKYILVLTFIFASLFVSNLAYADNIDYVYDNTTDTLTVTGSGAMEDYNENYMPPWHRYSTICKNIVIGDNITVIGSYSFAEFSGVTDVTIPESVSEIHFGSFSQCENLLSLYVPKSTLSITDASFAYYGNELKDDFVLKGAPGSYALHYAKQNSIPFDMNSTPCGVTQVNIAVKTMKAYYKYEAKVNGTFRIYSSGAQDTFGALYDSDFNLIASNDDISPDSNANFSINAQLVKGNTYYIKTYLVSSGLTGQFNLRIVPISYDLSFTVNAMKNRQGEASNILITDALVDGVPCGGSYTETVTQNSVVKTVSYNGEERIITFTPDSDDKIVFMTVDVNDDGFVNAKDYALMKRSDSPYLSLFENFISI